jgi:hypothetical protein
MSHWLFAQSAEVTLAGKSFRFLIRLTQSNTDAAAVFVDELDACLFECQSNDLQRGRPRLMNAGLKLANSDHPDLRLFREILLAPIEKPASGAALAWRDHGTCKKTSLSKNA